MTIETDDEGLIRLQKLLAQSGVASRRKCEELMLDGLVTVDARSSRASAPRSTPARR